MTSVTGYGKNFGAGGFTEAGRAVVRRLREAGIPYLRLPMMETKQSTKRGRDETAGDALPLFLRGTMAAQGYPGHFRMYRRNLDGNEERVYRKY